MFARKEDHVRDGKHCDLCGCTNPAVRCDKCNSQVFCLSCDDMYHRHPKRRLHLRKAVDSFNPKLSSARPVTPNKPPPGDPSKMPIPPPRKKKPKNFFGTLMRGSSPNESPILPKKEFSWMDKFGTIKRFMSNRPLPPLPAESSPSPEPAFPVGTIYQNVPDRLDGTQPPLPRIALPRRHSNPSFANGTHHLNGTGPHHLTDSEQDERPIPPPKQNQFTSQLSNNDEQLGINRARGNSVGEPGKWGQGSKILPDSPTLPMEYPIGDKHVMNHPGMMPNYATFRRLSPHAGLIKSRSPSPSPTHEGGSSMHQSSSLTDLNSLPATPGPYPYYPHHPHQPFLPMFPAHSYAHLNCPQCYVGPWPPSADNCEYCNSSNDPKHKHAHHSAGNRVKRSQSVMYDNMNNPMPYFPFAPGYGPFYPHGHHFETPPSPTSSARSLQNANRQRRKHNTDDNASVASSNRSRGKSTSSGQQKSVDNESMEISSEEEEDDEEEEEEEIDNKKKSGINQNSGVKVGERNAASPQPGNSLKPWTPNESWSCEYCTYINPPGVRICTICCKTITVMGSTSKNVQEGDLLESEGAESAPLSNHADLAAESNVTQLTSALDEAEKEMNKELNELMKVKDESQEEGKVKEEIEETKNETVEAQTQKIQYCEIAIGTDTLPEPTENGSVHVNTSEHYVTEASTTATTTLNNVKRRDSSCQTYDNVTLAADMDNKLDVPHVPPLTNGYNGHAETRTVSLGTSPPNYQKEDGMSPQFYPERSNLAGMRRSLSRLSLNYGPRQSEFRQQQYQSQDWLGYGEPLYRSVSQSSLTGDSDIWSPDLRRKKPDYYLSIEELVERRRQEAMRAQGLEIVRMIREAEQKGFTADDLQIALNNCGKSNPVEWLENNWKNMVKTVVTLATNYGHDKKENDIGIVSSNEAREALKIHKGNIWAAVTECVESRQRKFLELSARGNFSRKEVIGALTSNEGNVELAYTELTKATLKPFLMRIWGQGSGAENESGVVLRQHKSETRNFYNENMKTNSIYDNFPHKDDYDLELDDYGWNDGVSDASFREYDSKLDSRSNDDDYEYENSYDYPESNYKYDKKGNLVPRHQNVGDFRADYNEVLDLSQQTKVVDNDGKKEESKKNRSSGFLSKLVSLKKTNKDQTKPEVATNVVENYKEEDGSKTDSKKLQAASNENVSKQKVKSEDTTSRDEDNTKSVGNLATDGNSEPSSTASSQVNEVKKASMKANSSFSNLLKHFSSDKSVSSKAESESSPSKNSTKDKSLTSKEIPDVTERNSSKSAHKEEEKSVEKSEETENATKSEEIRENIDSKNTMKANLETEKISSNLENKDKEEVKEIKSATGAISKNTKRSETSMIGKTIGKFNFMSAKSTVDKKSPEITRTIKKQTENTPLNQNKIKEKSIQPVKDQDSRSESPSSLSPTPLEDIANINSKDKETIKTNKEESKSVDVKTERMGSPLGKRNIFNRFSGEKTEGKTLGKKETPSVNAAPPKKDDILGKKRTWMTSLQKPNEKQLIFERKVRRLLAEEKCDTYEKAEIAVKLIEMNFNEEDVIQAMKDCSSLDQAFTYLQQDCELCVGIYPASKMVSMIHCIHRACRDCLRTYFTIQIRDRNIRELMCPYCNEPDLDNEDIAMDYFNHLDIMLKKLIDPDIHELFQQKLRDRVLMKDPNFHWCSQCSSGFITVPDLTKLVCPDCKAVTCAQCRRLWEKQHEGISCEQFTEWKEANDPEAQAAGLAKHLTDNGIDCPNCKFRYSLAKGGCMHFRCIQCQYDFCSGCGKPFKMGQKCTVSDFCAKLGLHAHHPRNCLFYLRDKEPADLQKLLDENDIGYNREPSEGTEVQNVCQVMEQKETPQGMKDDICGKEVEQEYAGLCRIHYVEYLGNLVNKYNIDPLPIFTEDDLEMVLKRAQIRLPSRQNHESHQQQREKLIKLIQEKLPLEVPEGS
ncbi:uncharacterized protein LOC111626457 isoform X2 [Centruroides sculpturatus]|uniref:uncharacterized protein LOC111626457 isoform X2 n=1 Tax=Centruroides sculpturatus TaxID=218467 RepID=UPI000C6C9154|nr:uncharacterized protein LOC111626457 isoform X2 [Centruroides sculpturatus]